MRKILVLTPQILVLQMVLPVLISCFKQKSEINEEEPNAEGNDVGKSNKVSM